MSKVAENIISVTVPVGTRTAVVNQDLDGGKIIAVLAYHSNFNAGEYCRLGIRDAQGNEVSKLQNIENYRSRNVEYLKDGKFLQLDGGRSAKVEVNFKANLTVEATIDVIFIYASEPTQY